MHSKPTHTEQNLTNELDGLIKSIQRLRPAMDEKDISLAMNYNSGYLSQVKSRDKVSPKLIDKVKSYLQTLHNANQGNPVQVKEEGTNTGEWGKIAEANLLNAQSIAEMVAMLKKRDEQLERINASLAQLPIDMVALTAKIQEGQRTILTKVESFAPAASHNKKSSQKAKH